MISFCNYFSSPSNSNMHHMIFRVHVIVSSFYNLIRLILELIFFLYDLHSYGKNTFQWKWCVARFFLGRLVVVRWVDMKIHNIIVIVDSDDDSENGRRSVSYLPVRGPRLPSICHHLFLSSFFIAFFIRASPTTHFFAAC